MKIQLNILTFRVRTLELEIILVVESFLPTFLWVFIYLWVLLPFTHSLFSEIVISAFPHPSYPVFLYYCPKVYRICPLVLTVRTSISHIDFGSSVLPKCPSSQLELQLWNQHEHCSQRSILICKSCHFFFSSKRITAPWEQQGTF